MHEGTFLAQTHARGNGEDGTEGFDGQNFDWKGNGELAGRLYLDLIEDEKDMGFIVARMLSNGIALSLRSRHHSRN